MTKWMVLVALLVLVLVPATVSAHGLASGPQSVAAQATATTGTGGQPTAMTTATGGQPTAMTTVAATTATGGQPTAMATVAATRATTPMATVAGAGAAATPATGTTTSPSGLPKTGGESLPWLLALGGLVLFGGLVLRRRPTA